MELLFFPAMTKGTFFQTFTAFFVACNEGTGLPIFAKFGIISEKIWFSSEILKVVSVDALCFVMFVIVWAPLGFEEEYVKIIVLVTR